MDAIQQKARSIARYMCYVYNRMELCDDIEQDLAEAMLRGVKDWALKKRAISAILSKRYNQQYIGAKKTWYSFVDYGQCGDMEEPIPQTDKRIYAEQLLQMLSPLRREYITLWLHGYSQDEIAGMYHVTRTNITHLISKSLEQMREGDKDGISDIS